MAKKKDKKKGKKNKSKMTGMPLFPGMPPMPDALWGGDGKAGKENFDAQAQECASSMKLFLGKSIDMQKASADGAKDQFSQFFAYMMDLQDDFVESLPDQALSMPGMPEYSVSPKSFMKSMQEFEEMANEYFVEQMDSCTSFFFQSQQKAVDMIPEPPQAADEQEETAEAEEEPVEEKAAEEEEEAAEEEAAEEEDAQEEPDEVAEEPAEEDAK